MRRAAGPVYASTFARGCRDGLAPAWPAELSTWLAQWEAEAHAMSLGLDVLEALGAGGASVREVWRAALGVAAGAPSPLQVFGIRTALYPATRHDGARMVAARDVVVTGRNLTDRLWEVIHAALADAEEPRPR